MTDDRRPEHVDPDLPTPGAAAPDVPRWASTSQAAQQTGGGVWSARPSKPARPVQAAPAPAVPQAPLVPPAPAAPLAPPAPQAQTAPPAPWNAPPAAASAPTAPAAAAAMASPTGGDASPTTAGWAIVDPSTPKPSAAPLLGTAPVGPLGAAAPAFAAPTPDEQHFAAAAPGAAGPVPAPQTGAAFASAATADVPDRTTPGASGGEPPAGGRPRWLVPVVIGAVVLIVGGVAGGILATRGGDDAPPPAAASTIVIPPPTATVAPVVREATTPFATVLPATLLQYALTTSGPADAWSGAGAIEAYTDTYDDGAGTQITVLAGQWETAEEAAAFAQQLVETLGDVAAQPADDSATPETTEPTAGAAATVDEPRSGDVLVGGQSVGSYVITDQGDGNSVAVWWNGTAVFQLTAPTGDIANLYAAYPL
ncbi:hypothetical protein ACTHAM_000900 [Cellulomonas soli]|uniref:hypothetical protein n=1 Tax=Cellulomonas soli TaxID=931535 RepID=UPI003F87D76D